VSTPTPHREEAKMDGRRREIVERISRRMAVRGLGAAGLGAALGVAVRPAVAQDATPSAEACPGDPHAGDTVPVIGPDGAVILTLTVTEVIDPFEEYDPTAPPARGQRFVVVRIDAEGIGPRPFDLDPNAFYLQDADGFLARPIGLRLGPEVTLTPLARIALEDGAVAKGFLAYAVLGGVRLDRLFFAPASDRLVLVADLRG
jgi:hypothetical protein